MFCYKANKKHWQQQNVQQPLCTVAGCVPVSPSLAAVGVHLSPPLSQQVVQTQLTGGVVAMEVLVCCYRLLQRFKRGKLL